MPTTSPSALIGALLALASASFYGSGIVIARIVSDAGLNPVALVFYRTAVVVVGLVVLLALWRRPVAVAKPDRPLMIALVISSILIAICYISAVVFVPVTVAAIVFYTFPVLIVLASPLVEGRRLTAPLAGIAALAFVGVACVVGPAFDGLDWRGVALAGLASAAAATQFFVGVRARHVPLATKVLWINAATLPASFVVAAAFGVMNPPGDLMLAPVAVTLGVLTFVAAFTLQFVALARAGAVATGLSFCIEPVVAALGAAFVIGEALDALQVAGVALVIVAIAGNVLIESRREARRRRTAAA